MSRYDMPVLLASALNKRRIQSKVSKPTERQDILSTTALSVPPNANSPQDKPDEHARQPRAPATKEPSWTERMKLIKGQRVAFCKNSIIGPEACRAIKNYATICSYIKKHDRDFHGTYHGVVLTAPGRKANGTTVVEERMDISLDRYNMKLSQVTLSYVEVAIQLQKDLDKEGKKLKLPSVPPPVCTIEDAQSDSSDVSFGGGLSPVSAHSGLDQSFGPSSNPPSFEDFAAVKNRTRSRSDVEVADVAQCLTFSAADNSASDSSSSVDLPLDQGGDLDVHQDDPLTAAQMAEDESPTDFDQHQVVRDIYKHPAAEPFVSRVANLQWNMAAKPVPDPQFYDEDPRISGKGVLRATSPLDVFFQLFPLEVFEKITVFTNLYRQQKGATREGSIPQDNVLRFSALLIAHALHPYPCGIGRQWRKSGVGPFPAGSFGQYMSRNAFQEVSSYLHLSDNTEAPKDSPDKLKKIRLLADMMSETFPQQYALGRHVSFDEGGIATKSKYAPCTIINDYKPKSRNVHDLLQPNRLLHWGRVLSGKYSRTPQDQSQYDRSQRVVAKRACFRRFKENRVL